mmetsp:Transcript_18669/g.38381  ORF Transcript_18669/g.38381 Transcript_18669/m.38381 type:complete len:246 (+) Transcript_18669:402-1139(+)
MAQSSRPKFRPKQTTVWWSMNPSSLPTVTAWEIPKLFKHRSTLSSISLEAPKRTDPSKALTACRAQKLPTCLSITTPVEASINARAVGSTVVVVAVGNKLAVRLVLDEGADDAGSFGGGGGGGGGGEVDRCPPGEEGRGRLPPPLLPLPLSSTPPLPSTPTPPLPTTSFQQLALLLLLRAFSPLRRRLRLCLSALLFNFFVVASVVTSSCAVLMASSSCLRFSDSNFLLTVLAPAPCPPSASPSA